MTLFIIYLIVSGIVMVSAAGEVFKKGGGFNKLFALLLLIFGLAGFVAGAFQPLQDVVADQIVDLQVSVDRELVSKHPDISLLNVDIDKIDKLARVSALIRTAQFPDSVVRPPKSNATP